ncbi:unnamed protein product [Lasius platythorax]|uniref:Uncharacterized protein n=1 Tax=Lasius platythorax TaxID=488582 RepID=A0AAV2MZJ8_9HYME
MKIPRKGTQQKGVLVPDVAYTIGRYFAIAWIVTAAGFMCPGEGSLAPAGDKPPPPCREQLTTRHNISEKREREQQLISYHFNSIAQSSLQNRTGRSIHSQMVRQRHLGTQTIMALTHTGPRTCTRFVTLTAMTTDIDPSLAVVRRMTKPETLKTLQNAQMVGDSAGGPSQVDTTLVEQPNSCVRGDLNHSNWAHPALER